MSTKYLLGKYLFRGKETVGENHEANFQSYPFVPLKDFCLVLSVNHTLHSYDLIILLLHFFTSQ